MGRSASRVRSNALPPHQVDGYGWPADCVHFRAEAPQAELVAAVYPWGSGQADVSTSEQP